MASPVDRANLRFHVLTSHLQPYAPTPLSLSCSPCLSYSPPELSESPFALDLKEMRSLLDGHNVKDRDWLFNVIAKSQLFNPKRIGQRVFVGVDYDQSMEQQREATWQRIEYMKAHGVFKDWLGNGAKAELRKLALHEVLKIYDHSLAVKIGVHFFLWYFFHSHYWPYSNLSFSGHELWIGSTYVKSRSGTAALGLNASSFLG